MKAASLNRPSLTRRENQILRLIAWGETNKDIASMLRLSVKTIEAHKANAMRKMGMLRRSEIVRYAVAHGWLVMDAMTTADTRSQDNYAVADTARGQGAAHTA